MTCRTPDEAYQAGHRDGQQDPPLTAGQVTAIALLLAPHRAAAGVAARRAS